MLLHPGLAVRAVAEGLDRPTSLAFLGANDMLVLEKNTGRAQRVVGRRHPVHGPSASACSRWPPTNIADTPEPALSRLFRLPCARCSGREFSWRFEVAPGAVGFVEGSGLGAEFAGDLFVGAARTSLAGGRLFHFNLTGNRQKRSAWTTQGWRTDVTT